MTRLLLCLSLLAFTVTQPALADPPPGIVPGKHFEAVTPAQPVEEPGKIEVVEIFWYGCPHCYDAEPIIKAWVAAQAEDVVFRRLPGVFRRNWVPHAKAFYTAEALGVLDSIHAPLFDAIHRDRQPMDTPQALEALFVEHGVTAEDFRKTFNSFTVDSKVRQAMQMTRNYGITGVPAVVVNGAYRTSGAMAGSFETLLKVMDHLVAKAREESPGGGVAGAGPVDP